MIGSSGHHHAAGHAECLAGYASRLFSHIKDLDNALAATASAYIAWTSAAVPPGFPVAKARRRGGAALYIMWPSRRPDT